MEAYRNDLLKSDLLQDCPEMNTVAPLQVLLFLLPVMGGKMHRRDEQVEMEAGQYTGHGEHVPWDTSEVCFGTPRTCVNVETIPRMTQTEKAVSRPWFLFKTCYKKIRVVMTPECSALQSTDFSRLTIRDFCVGEEVEIEGLIDFRVGMTAPSLIIANVSHVNSQNSDNAAGEPLLHRRPSYSFMVDACELFGGIICPRGRQWCGCPIVPGAAVFYKTKIFIGQDILPIKANYGSLKAYLRLNTPEDSVCVNLTFERKIVLVIP